MGFMALYHIHFLDHADNIFGSEMFEAEHDKGAIERAQARYRSGIGKGYEIWQGNRQIHSELNNRPE